MDAFCFDEMHQSQLPKTPKCGLIQQLRTGQWRLQLPEAQLPA